MGLFDFLKGKKGGGNAERKLSLAKDLDPAAIRDYRRASISPR
jgi:hypothetical protein